MSSCIVTVNALGNVKEVSCAYLGEDDEKEKQIIDFLGSHVEITNKLDCSNIPSEVLHYCVIPMSFSNDEWDPNFVYHACIRSLTCHISDDGKDVDVKVSAYVFNGGNVRVMAKFFNRIRSGGKADFDDFCYAFDLVNEDGTVDPESASGQLCSVSLYQNSKGNFYRAPLKTL